MLKRTLFFRNTLGFIFVEALIVLLVLGLPLSSQVISPAPIDQTYCPLTVLSAEQGLCVADPKLDGGEIPIQFLLMPKGKTYQVSIQVLEGAQPYREIFSGPLQGAWSPYLFYWDGKDTQGRYADPGNFTISVKAVLNKEHKQTLPITIVRLGITEIRALPGAWTNEWQMVYFKKGSAYEFYATPALCEYANKAKTGDVSDLDLNDGTPRPSAPLHKATDSPVMAGSSYETQRYNYPLCYRTGSRPVFEVTLGASCTSQQGVATPCGYPVSGMEIRGMAVDTTGVWSSAASPISPGMRYTFTGPELPLNATRSERVITWYWQYRKQGSPVWHDIPGNMTTEHRFYTILNEPVWADGVSGTQYAGPWVEVADYFYSFSDALGIDTSDEAGVVKALVRGFFGQEGSLTEAIEGVIYDTYTMGGDGGASHYYGSSTANLSRLLNNHANGIYVNCSDVAACASVMIGMLGVNDIQMLRLGPMQLRAIWGIGCPGYTLNLWGGGSHSFSYHHIMTRDGGVHVSDACMWLDEDGNPDALPGIPGYNHDRLWTDFRYGYNTLSSTNNVSKTLNPLPKIK
ncbi:MAG: hypothetical protein ABIK28_12150 [Planctomycetota bacterium]